MTQSLVSIGDFSRMTYLTVKALRYYHDVGLLEPASIDEASGYRSYDQAQVPMAQVIRRLRTLEMPLEAIRAVVEAPDLEARNKAISEHLKRMEDQLSQTRDTVKSLRSLLERPRVTADVTFRAVPALRAISIQDRVLFKDAGDWVGPAYVELHETLDSAGLTRAGVDGCLFSPDIFEKHDGILQPFIPVTEPIAALSGLGGRVEALELPATELAILIHEGPGDSIDETYAALGTYVTERAIGVAGPMWENFVVSGFDTDDASQHRTEVGWPIFRTQPS
jgi:DNA-binding transcriptional MerR regulator